MNIKDLIKNDLKLFIITVKTRDTIQKHFSNIKTCISLSNLFISN